MHRRTHLLLAAALALLIVPATAVAKAKAKPVRYYLALGDSLSQGQQPNLAGVSTNTNQGYADDLYPLERARIKNLKLVKLGCGGETTTSMITGKGNKYAAYNRCHPAGGSQLAAAVRFLKAHHRSGEVPLVTIDIGANDVDNCTSPGVQLGPCLTAGEASIKTNTPKILNAIRNAAPAKTTLVAMNLYDPVLGGYFSANPSQKSLALASPALARSINQEIADANTAAGFRTADVADAFATYDNTDMVTWEGQSIPLNVARVCAWTWACSTPPSGPNIHANKNGYLVIASAFDKVIGRLK